MNLDAQLAQVVRDALKPMLSEAVEHLEARLAERLAWPVPAPTPTVPPLLTLDDVAVHLRVTTRTVQRRVAAGEFPRPILVGPTSPRWRRADLDAWIQAQESQG